MPWTLPQKTLPKPPLAGGDLLEPPEQKKPWTPPQTALPKLLLSATAALFEAGLADPRGGEYRVIKIRTGSCWSGDAGVAETRGWLLPAGKDANRFAVCWNGLVYPLVSIGDKADLQADVLALINADEKSRAGRKDFNRDRNAASESFSVSHRSMLPIKACLLLRLGEGALAQKLWTAWTAGMRPNTNDNDLHLKDPFWMLAVDWVWSGFDRAICAHMRGDDRLALVDARALIGMKKAVEAEAKRRGLAQENDRREPLYFLAPLADLLADQERRAKPAKRQPIADQADKTRRIAALIDALENVAARQWGQPGGVELSQDWSVQALIKEGEAAVEPLLDCLEKDDRLTRSVHFHRDFFRHRSILGVHEAAYVALAGILQTSFFGVGSTGDDLTARGEKGRKQVAASIRSYWKRFKEVPLEERWYLILKNDKAPPGHWLQAAANITRPVDVSVSRGSMFGTDWTTIPERGAGEKPALRGEVLRKKKDPMVTELLVKRVEAFCQLGTPGTEQFFAIHKACQMAYDLAAWDPAASAPVLAKMVRMCREYIVEQRQGDTDLLGAAIARLTRLRVQAGDARALDEYANWIRTLHPKGTRHSWNDILQPMWENPEHPAIAEAAEAMFNTAKSAWTEKFLRSYNTHGLSNTPMLGLAGFRKRLHVELVNRQPAGQVDLDRGSLELDTGWGGQSINPKGDPLAPPTGTKKITFRVCDYYAYHLSRLEGLPRCELYWPEPERDKAVAACAGFLTKYGERFKFVDPWPDDNGARMTFPRRNVPATLEEARDGRAIFAFAKEDKVRVWKMPAFPMKARWFTLKDFPYEVQFYSPKLKMGGTRTEYAQKGWVWQAEEILKDGKWQRYYGFVGKYVLAKVPAEQIDFPALDYRWAELEGGIDCRVIGPEKIIAGQDGWNTPVFLKVGDPLLLRVHLRNRSGLERPVPAEFVRRDPHKGLMLHVGMKPRLYHAAENKKNDAEDEESTWKELTPKVTAHYNPGPAVKIAAPGETFAEFELNLAQCFNITEAGHYRVQLHFSNQDGGFAKGSTQEIQFHLGATLANVSSSGETKTIPSYAMSQPVFLANSRIKSMASRLCVSRTHTINSSSSISSRQSSGMWVPSTPFCLRSSRTAAMSRGRTTTGRGA